SRAAPDGGATGRVGDIHLFAEHLGDESGVRSFRTASAGAGEFKQRLVELRTLDHRFGRHAGFLADIVVAVVEDRLHVGFFFLRDHLDGAGRADGYTFAAAHAVQRRNSDGELVAGIDPLDTLDRDGADAFRSGGSLFLGEDIGTDGRVR